MLPRRTLRSSCQESRKTTSCGFTGELLAFWSQKWTDPTIRPSPCYRKRRQSFFGWGSTTSRLVCRLYAQAGSWWSASRPECQTSATQRNSPTTSCWCNMHSNKLFLSFCPFVFVLRCVGISCKRYNKTKLVTSSCAHPWMQAARGWLMHDALAVSSSS